MPYVPPPDELARLKKDYYRNKRPDLDPQSTVSKIMEYFGADEPYREDSGSYDYRQKQWDKSNGNPDVSWLLPELSDSAVEGIVGAPKQLAEDVAGIAGGNEHGRRDSGYAAAALREQLGREPTEDEIAGAVEAINDDNIARRNMRTSLGREPTDAEWKQWKSFSVDPRSTSERNAGAVLNFLDLPLLGGADEAAAGIISGADDIGKGLARVTGIKALDPERGSYEQELALARKVKRGYQQNEPGTSARNLASTAGGVGMLFTGPAAASWHAADALWKGGRTAAGLAPEAVTLLGKAAQQTVPGAMAGAADFAGLGFNEGEGGFKQRAENISGDDVKSGAIGGGLLFPLAGAMGSGVVRGAKRLGQGATELGSNVIKRFSGKGKAATSGAPEGPKPTEPRKPFVKAIPKEAGDDSVRGAVEAAFKKQTKKARRT